MVFIPLSSFILYMSPLKIDRLISNISFTKPALTALSLVSPISSVMGSLIKWLPNEPKGTYILPAETYKGATSIPLSVIKPSSRSTGSVLSSSHKRRTWPVTCLLITASIPSSTVARAISFELVSVSCGSLKSIDSWAASTSINPLILILSIHSGISAAQADDELKAAPAKR